MMPYFTEIYGNPSSLHFFGTQAKEVLEQAKQEISAYMGAKPDEIIFTSGGTEANNFAIKGIAFANRNKGNHIMVSAIEHDCILNTCKWLESQRFFVTYIPVNHEGMVDTEMLRNLINPKTILVSVMYGNNEIGTLQPIEEIGRICRDYQIAFHSDACQSFGKVPVNVEQNHIDLLTINSHKIYGPKGVGALYVRKGTAIALLLHGGGQEEGLRSSTENIPGIAGFAKATQLCMAEMTRESIRLTALRKKLTGFLFDRFANVYINGHAEN
jgi:cysteine desulfurase